ncbi:hypothetical protein BDQ94DRAFT_148353 [Aspergillus welwitschiae]|uniref:Uncharacterized protein n=1 Tax=Aspergillus welwitschiae TaxID=1341132 RepID=A0A3F3PUR3_9EURO|nr:hypothetical protein BDQ94DRAFT_148353 [Aspergillus welwitschiae]RDH30690.1 hypothetical protein BDQ94DRAFT_148353 [Aspergillus welwitschiae]
MHAGGSAGTCCVFFNLALFFFLFYPHEVKFILSASDDVGDMVYISTRVMYIN